MLVKPYGDTENDGAVQLSFTLKVDASPRGRAAARELVLSLGFNDATVVDETPIGAGLTMYVVYGKTDKAVDLEKLVVDDAHLIGSMDYYEVNRFIETRVGRKVVVVGACTGFDAHTIGIDAVMNMKGYNQHYGLERYKMIEAINLGAQVENERLVQHAVRVSADVILVSQIVTQKDIHVENLKALRAHLESEGLEDRFITVVGGPRITHQLALDLGFDAGFGKGTYAEHVASFFVRRLAERMEMEQSA
jgi:beta-lysine 5,6-aminomutase beta subunit